MIKYIHCFGTSFSAGGGFEFESNQIFKPILKKLYSKCGEELTQYNFSWPGQLQKLLKNNKIKVINHAKSGFGNETMYRITYDLISGDDFNIDENLFIFEFSYVGRREYFLNSIGDYIVVNYNNIENLNNENGYIELGYNYFYDNKDIQNKLSDFRKVILPFFNYSKNQKIVEKQVEQNNCIFYNFLKNMNINFLFSEPPEPINLFSPHKTNFLYAGFENHNISINDGKKMYRGVLDLVGNSNDIYSISYETNNVISDSHLGLKGNKLVAVNVFNKLINKNYISSNSIDINDVLNEKINIGNFI